MKLSNRESLRSLNTTAQVFKQSRKSQEFIPSTLILEEPEEDVYKTLVPSKEYTEKALRKSASSLKDKDHLSFINRQNTNHMADHGGTIDLVNGSNKIKVNRRKLADANKHIDYNILSNM